jgi:hypothetical protein
VTPRPATLQARVWVVAPTDRAIANISASLVAQSQPLSALRASPLGSTMSDMVVNATPFTVRAWLGHLIDARAWSSHRERARLQVRQCPDLSFTTGACTSCPCLNGAACLGACNSPSVDVCERRWYLYHANQLPVPRQLPRLRLPDGAAGRVLWLADDGRLCSPRIRAAGGFAVVRF